MEATENTFAATQKYTREKAIEAFKFIAPDGDLDLADAKAARTFCQYASVWRNYVAWCEETGLTPMPSPASQLRAYLRYMSGAGYSSKTCDGYMAALATIHRLNGHAFERSLLVEHLKAIRRRGGRPRQARAMMRPELGRILDRLEPGRPRDARDGAMLVLGWSCALRSAEIVGLDWQNSGTAVGCTGILTEERRGFQVRLLVSKGSQMTPVDIPIPHDQMPSVRAWVERWVVSANVQPGEPLFRPVHKNQATIFPARLAPDAVAQIIKARVRATELAHGRLEGAAHRLAHQFSGHSLRRGYCSAAAEAGTSLGQIRRRSRHSSDEVLGRYIRSVEGWDTSGLRKIGF